MSYRVNLAPSILASIQKACHPFTKLPRASTVFSINQWVSLVAQMVKSLPAMWETQVPSLGWEDSPGEGKGNPLQYFCLENPMDRGAWRATTVHVVAKSQTSLGMHTHMHAHCIL